MTYDLCLLPFLLHALDPAVLPPTTHVLLVLFLLLAHFLRSSGHRFLLTAHGLYRIAMYVHATRIHVPFST